MKQPRHTPLPVHLTLPALQRFVRAVVRERGFTTALDKVFILLVEEVGELSAEVVRRPQGRAGPPPRELGLEVADVLLYLVDLANGFGVDLAACWAENEPGATGDGAAQRARGDTLNALIARLDGGEAGSERAPGTRPLDALWEATGRLATVVRKHWKDVATPEVVAAGLGTALVALGRVSREAGMDLEAAVSEKVRLNARRTWAY